ncbi:hypothetical protein ACKWTF_005316 [Chironomus riparius]
MSISSTVDSLEALDYINRQYIDLAIKFGNNSNILAEKIPNLQFDESEGIHVGNVIYNIHHHSKKTDLTDSTTASINSYNFKVKSTFGRFEKYGRCKIYWSLLLITAIICTSAAVSVSVYFVLRDKLDTTTVSSNETTVTEFTTLKTSTEPYDFDALITREEWGAININLSIIPKLSMPIKRIIIAQTLGQFCTNKTNCISTVKSMQTQNSGLDDIPYNYLIGGDGRIYEGRGIEYQGQHTSNLDATEYNSIGICIAFIGNYQSIAPNSSQISLLTEFIDFYKEKGSIADDYIIVLQDDLKFNPIKANALNTEIKKLVHFRPLFKIHRREEWEAQNRTDLPTKFGRTLNWFLIGHTDDILCTNLDDCKYLARDIQSYSFSRGWSDILYNVFFGGDGFAFEGRGFDNWGSHDSKLNDKAIGVGVMGSFHSVPPNQAIIDAMLQVFDDTMALGKIKEDYKIFGRTDFGGPGPGAAFMNIIKEWCHYGNRTGSC